MWTVAKINKKRINLFKEEIKNRCGMDLVLYQPSFQFEKVTKNKLEKNTKPLLEDYFFCYSKKFEDINFVNTLKYIKGVKYFLESFKTQQQEIIKFIEQAKVNQNAQGFISSAYFYNIITSRGKFVSGPFTNMLFDIIEKNKNKLKVLIGNYKVSISKKDNNLYFPT